MRREKPLVEIIHAAGVRSLFERHLAVDRGVEICIRLQSLEGNVLWELQSSRKASSNAMAAAVVRASENWATGAVSAGLSASLAFMLRS